ncbi:MAG: response regulator, partial [Candidatus Dormibacteria bacterium]
MARIYILDDSPTVLANMERALTSAGTHELSGSSSNPQEALQQIENLHPDVIIIDLDLKDADASSIIRDVRKATSWIVIVAMSANDDDATLALARNAGAQEFLPKPFAKDELFGAIENALQHQAAITPAEYDNALQA